MSHDARAPDDQHRHAAQHSTHSQCAQPRYSRTRAKCLGNLFTIFPGRRASALRRGKPPDP
eukprot:1700058-Alexandrium_andersonii.AAC.1